jgi:hypothetical protein
MPKYKISLVHSGYPEEIRVIPVKEDEVVHITARYYNSMGIGVAIVAVVNYYEGELFDWAAYIGGSKKGAEREEWCTEDVAAHGCKLSRADAMHYFPELDIGRYRL